MNPQDAVDLSREAIKTCLMVGGPILAASLLIGLVVGVFQAMTQVQDQTVSFVPKILLLIVAIGLCLPWLTDQMLDFAKYSFEKPMTHWSGNGDRESTFPSADKTAANQVSPTFEKSASVAQRLSPPMLNAAFATGTSTSNAIPDQTNTIPNAVQPGSWGSSMPNAVKPTIPQPKQSGSPFLLPQYRQRPSLPHQQTDIGG